MATHKRSTKYKAKHYRESQVESVKVNVKVIISLLMILTVLLMKKYDYSIGDVNVDTLYNVVYDNENFEQLEGAFNESIKTTR